MGYSLKRKNEWTIWMMRAQLSGKCGNLIIVCKVYLDKVYDDLFVLQTSVWIICNLENQWCQYDNVFIIYVVIQYVSKLNNKHMLVIRCVIITPFRVCEDFRSYLFTATGDIYQRATTSQTANNILCVKRNIRKNHESTNTSKLHRQRETAVASWI